MSRRKSALGIAMALALVVSAFAAANASAIGTTAVTCAPNVGAGKQFSDAHCKTASSGENGFKHVEFTGETTITGGNGETGAETKSAAPAVLKGTPGGVKAAVTCTTVSGTGTMSNSKSGTEMVASGSGVITYTGCSVTEPAGKGCTVVEEKVVTNSLKATTEGQGMFVNFTPASGTEFATVKITGCSVEGLNNNFPVAGSVKSTPSGATLTTTEAEVTTANTLKFGGQKAGLEGALTIKGHKAGETTNPLSVTTLE